jgi:SAM-dependent methyltransferase
MNALWNKEPDPQKAYKKYMSMHISPTNTAKNSMIIKLLDELNIDLNKKKVLDYGCGGGYFSVFFAKKGALVKGIDISTYSVNAARYHAYIENVQDLCTFFVDGSPEKIEEEESFDLILLKDVIEHVGDDNTLLANFTRKLKTNGYFILITHNSWSLNFLIQGGYERFWKGNKQWNGWDEDHVRFYNPVMLRKKLHTIGLRTIMWGSSYLFPYSILGNLILRRKIKGNKFLHCLDTMLGRNTLFSRLGWSLAVVCKK